MKISDLFVLPVDVENIIISFVADDTDTESYVPLSIGVVCFAFWTSFALQRGPFRVCFVEVCLYG